MKIALWVANRHRPFSIVEDPELLDIFTDLNPNCVTQKHHTVSRDVKEIFFLSQKEVALMLQASCPSLLFSIIIAYFMFVFRNTLDGFMLRLMGGRHQMLLHSLEPLFIGSLMARWCRLSLTSSSEVLYVSVIGF